jgi:hypothetical protein
MRYKVTQRRRSEMSAVGRNTSFVGARSPDSVLLMTDRSKPRWLASASWVTKPAAIRARASSSPRMRVGEGRRVRVG